MITLRRVGSLMQYLALVSIAFLLTGCTDSKPVVTNDEQIELPKPLSVTFVGVDDVADEVARQWSARRNGVVKTTIISTDELFSGEYSAIDKQDVLIYPSSLTGQLIADEKITEIPDEVWNSTDLDVRSLLRDNRTNLVRFDGKRWATPLGSPNLLLLVRKDVLERLAARIPNTWAEFVELAAKLNRSDDLQESNDKRLPTMIQFPMANQFAANSLFAIAASSVRHRGKLNFIFDRDTMKPLIDRSPYIDALNTLKQLLTKIDFQEPDEVMQAYFSGESAFAVGWPSKAFLRDINAADIESMYGNTELSRLPGSERWYDFSGEKWIPFSNGPSRIEVIGFGGYQASILKTVMHPTTSHDFLAWISSKEMSTNIFAKSRFGAPSRLSQIGNPENWLGEFVDVKNSETYSDLIQEIEEENVFFMFPRIKGSNNYLAVLSNAVREFMTNDLDAAEVLSNVASEWETITEQYGRDQQAELMRKDSSF